jgi:hypothetical protein
VAKVLVTHDVEANVEDAYAYDGKFPVTNDVDAKELDAYANVGYRVVRVVVET